MDPFDFKSLSTLFFPVTLPLVSGEFLCTLNDELLSCCCGKLPHTEIKITNEAYNLLLSSRGIESIVVGKTWHQVAGAGSWLTIFSPLFRKQSKQQVGWGCNPQSPPLRLPFSSKVPPCKVSITIQIVPPYRNHVSLWGAFLIHTMTHNLYSSLDIQITVCQVILSPCSSWRESHATQC